MIGVIERISGGPHSQKNYCCLGNTTTQDVSRETPHIELNGSSAVGSLVCGGQSHLLGEYWRINSSRALLIIELTDGFKTSPVDHKWTVWWFSLARANSSLAAS